QRPVGQPSSGLAAGRPGKRTRRPHTELRKRTHARGLLQRADLAAAISRARLSTGDESRLQQEPWTGVLFGLPAPSRRRAADRALLILFAPLFTEPHAWGSSGSVARSERRRS